MAHALDSLNTGMSHLAITAAGAAAPVAAAAGTLVERTVTPYTEPLADALPDVPKVLHELITSYLRPTDTELLLNATFIDFMADTPYRQEALQTVNIWARHLRVMDYSRVFMVFECGFLPLLEAGAPGDMADKVAFRGNREQGPVTHHIPCDSRVFPDLARIAHARFFPHVRELVNPGAHYSTHELARSSASIETAVELQALREQQPDYPAAIEGVAVRASAKAIIHEDFAPIMAKQGDPTYVVTLNLQPTRRNAEGETVLDHAHEPSLRMVRYVGTMRYEAECMVDHVVTHLPPEFAPVPLPDQAPDPDAVPIANEDGYFE